MSQEEFPVSKYYRRHVVDGITITEGGGWWSAALLIRDPKSRELFVGLYRWQASKDGWKTRGSFKLRAGDHVRRTVTALEWHLRRMGGRDGLDTMGFGDKGKTPDGPETTPSEYPLRLREKPTR